MKGKTSEDKNQLLKKGKIRGEKEGIYFFEEKIEGKECWGSDRRGYGRQREKEKLRLHLDGWIWNEVRIQKKIIVEGLLEVDWNENISRERFRITTFLL